MKRYYIAYGSNLSEVQMALRCPTAKVVGTSTLKDWRLLFNGPASIEEYKGYERFGFDKSILEKALEESKEW